MGIASWSAKLGGAVVLALATTPLYAQDLLDIWQLALQRDPIYAASQANRNAEQEAVPQARAQLLPYISASATGEVNDTRRRSTLNQSSTQQRGLWALSLSQPIIDIGAWGQLQQADSIAKRADVTQSQAYQDLILRVSLAYFNVLAAQDTLRALEAQKSAVQTQLQAAKLGFELGSTTITDTHEAQARLDLLLATELQAENDLQLSRDQLAKIINQRPADLAQLDPATPLPAPQPNRLDDWTDQASNASLDVLLARLNEHIAEQQIKIAKSQHYPRLSLQAQTGSASDRGLYGPSSGPRSVDSSVGLMLSIPVFTGGEISSVVREQSSRLQQARYNLEDAKRLTVQNTRRYFSGVTSGLAQIHALQAAERSSLAALKANELAYQIGVRINIDVLNAQQQLYETQRRLLLTRYETLLDSLRLKAVSGILSDTDITALNQLLTVKP
ncbi:MAG: TolC family outer membrane protein [Burkholderiaceae bacterium]|nr:TolC family outer membrane protein [Burkholderiaceae bacterium]